MLLSYLLSILSLTYSAYPCKSVLVRGALYLLALRAEILLIFDPPDLPIGRRTRYSVINCLTLRRNMHATINSLCSLRLLQFLLSPKIKNFRGPRRQRSPAILTNASIRISLTNHRLSRVECSYIYIRFSELLSRSDD